MAKKPITDQLLGSLMQKSLIQAPSADFEDNVMLRIEREVIHEKSIAKNVKMSLLFFTLGTGFGLLVSHLLPILGETLAGINMKTIVLAFQVVYVVLILTQLEKIIKLMSKMKAIHE